MDKIKCGQCGLVAFQKTGTCARCKGPLTASMGVNPYESDPTPAVNGFVKIGLLVLVLGGVGFGLYKAAAPAEPRKTAIVAEQNVNGISQQEIQKAFADEQKKDAERIAEMNKTAKAMTAPMDRQQMKEAFDKSAKAYGANAQRDYPVRR
jgi:hypothetical protein